MDTTARLNIPFIAPQQAQKHITHNEALRSLDLLVQPAVLDRTLTAPPSTPGRGDTYLVAAGGTGVWLGHDAEFACFDDGGWLFLSPAEGWQAYDLAAGERLVFASGAWHASRETGGPGLESFGVNTTADLSNRLSVASAASLFTHDGASHRMTLNKAAAGDTAGLLFATAYAGHAEIGLAGDNHLHVKVSPDGTSWLEALRVSSSSGAVGLLAGQLGFPATQNPSSDPNTLDDYEEGTFTPTLSFGGGATGISYGAATAGRYTKVGRLVSASLSVELTSKGTGTGLAEIAGLPFAPASGALGASCAVGLATGFAGITGSVLGMKTAGGSAIALYQSANGAATRLSNTQFTDTTLVSLTVSYDAA